MEEVTGAFAQRSKYSAFISYSHVDAAQVRKLHSKLEGYRLPKGLGRIDALNSKRQGIGKVFRDREDLSAAQNLSDAVTDALKRSEVLIVVCSPDAKASRWVSQEIDYFRQHCPGRPILAALVRGAPSDAFPEALTEGGTEPLAADLRKEGDGWKLGFLKVVAGIACVPLDALVQRDSQRQMRRVMAVTGVTALVAIGMGVMAILALQARAEAEEQRDAAEGLVAFMMTDLRKQLVAVGRLDVMEEVNARALAYYSDQGDVFRLSPESLEQRATILRTMGEDDDRRGDLSKAKEKFKEAHRFTGALLRQDTENPARLFAHAQSEYWIGYIHQKKTEYSKSISSYERSKTLFSKALENGADEIATKKELGWIENALGVVNQIGLNRPNVALEKFRKYKDYFEYLVRKNPGDSEILYSYADSHAWLSQSYMSLNDMDLALSHRRINIRYLDNLLRIDPKNDTWLWARIGAERDLFRLYFSDKQFRNAAISINNAQFLIEASDFDERNRQWHWQSAYVSLDKGFLAVALGRTADARIDLLRGKRQFEVYKRMTEYDEGLVSELEETIESLENKISGKVE